MGKTTTASLFQKEGIAIYDADAAVHEIYKPGGAAVAPLTALFPDAIIKGGVDRIRLGKLVLDNPAALKQLENIVHPLVGNMQLDFLRENAEQDAKMVVLDIPLLFENGGEKNIDVSILATAPYDIQKKRVLARKNMTEEKFHAILAKQMPDEEKRKKADFIVDTSKSVEDAYRQVKQIIRHLENRQGMALNRRLET